MKLAEIDLLKLMPKILQNDSTAYAIAKALQPQLQEAYNAVSGITKKPDIAPECILDEIAREKKINWYDTAAPIEQKRRIIKSADFVKRHLGTIAAIETTIGDYFGDGFVEEWFLYGGSPYCFRVHTTNEKVTEEYSELFKKALEHTKNKRSVLESVVINKRAKMEVNTGIVLIEAETINLKVGG